MKKSTKNNDNNRKIWALAFSLLCAVAVGVCTIANLVTENVFTWAIYPAISIFFGWLVLLPIISKKDGFLQGLVILTVLAGPFMMSVAGILDSYGWLTSIGLPITAISLAALWASYLLVRFAKTNPWNKAALVVLTFGSAGQLINLIAKNSITNENYWFSMFTGITVCVVIAIVLAIIGRTKSNSK
jgi:hypothetical protein